MSYQQKVTDKRARQQQPNQTAFTLDEPIIPLRLGRFNPVVSLRSIDRSSRYVLKSSGLIGWPCSVPMRMSMASEILSRSFNLAVEFWYIYWMHLKKLPFIPWESSVGSPIGDRLSWKKFSHCFPIFPLSDLVGGFSSSSSSCPLSRLGSESEAWQWDGCLKWWDEEGLRVV